MTMTDAHDEIMRILSEVEDENDLPSGTLKQIYDRENSVVHLRVRDNIHASLQGIVSEAAEKVRGDAV